MIQREIERLQYEQKVLRDDLVLHEARVAGRKRDHDAAKSRLDGARQQWFDVKATLAKTSRSRG